jgi:multicomponent Na+:H+ antiporter subunit G
VGHGGADVDRRGVHAAGRVGILRLPDTFTRMQASTKAVTLGVSAMMLATAAHFGDLGVSVRALTTVLFLFFHALGARPAIARDPGLPVHRDR